MKKLQITTIRGRFLLWTVPVLLFALTVVVAVLSLLSDRIIQEGAAKTV